MSDDTEPLHRARTYSGSSSSSSPDEAEDSGDESPSQQDDAVDIEPASAAEVELPPLVAACLVNTPRDLKTLLVAGHDPNATHSLGRTPMHAAAYAGSVECIGPLVKKHGHLDALDDQHNSPLHLACAMGNEEFVGVLVRNGANVNARDKASRTALHFCAIYGHVQLITYLVDQSAKVNAQDKYGLTPLHYAAHLGEGECVERLLAHRAKAIAIDHHGRTAIHYAASKGHVEVVELLADTASALSRTDKLGNTLLHAAVASGQLHCVEFVLQLLLNAPSFQSQSPATLKNKAKSTPAHLAAMHGFWEVLDLLLKHNIDLNARDIHERTVLHYAAACGDEDSIELLSHHHADMDLQDENGDTALMIAARKGRSRAVELLLSHQSKCNIANKNGETALHFACQSGNVNLISSLLAAGCSFEQSNTLGRTPLHFAALSGQSCVFDKFLATVPSSALHSLDQDRSSLLHLICQAKVIFDARNKPLQSCASIVQMLVERGVNCNAVDKSGRSALHYAAARADAPACRLLLEYGMDVRCVDSTGASPLHYAAAFDRDGECAMVLLTHLRNLASTLNSQGQSEDILLEMLVRKESSRGSNIFHLAALSGNDILLSELIMHTDNSTSYLNEPDNTQSTALHLAAGKGHLPVIRVLLQAGVELAVFDEDGLTPLAVAAANGKTDVCRLLLLEGADVDMSSDEQQLTALHCAAAWGFTSTVDLLIEKHADVDATDADNRSPLMYAAWKGHLGCCQALIDSDVNESSKKNGWTALHFAVAAGHDSCASFLVENGADVDLEDRKGRTPLMLAAIFGHADIVSSLVQEGADPCRLDKAGLSPMLRACLGGHSSVVVSLLEAANVKYTLTQLSAPSAIAKWTPWHCACMSRTTNEDLFSTLATCHGHVSIGDGFHVNTVDARGRTALHMAAMTNTSIAIENILSCNFQLLNLTDNYGATATLTAAKHDSVSALSMLVDAEADLLIQDQYGNTCLHYAARLTTPDCIGLLLEGVDVNDPVLLNIQNSRGETAAHFAAAVGSATALQQLLEAGARFDIEDHNGRLPIDVARASKHANVDEVIVFLSNLDQSNSNEQAVPSAVFLADHRSVLSELLASSPGLEADYYVGMGGESIIISNMQDLKSLEETREDLQYEWEEKKVVPEPLSIEEEHDDAEDQSGRKCSSESVIVLADGVDAADSTATFSFSLISVVATVLFGMFAVTLLLRRR